MQLHVSNNKILIKNQFAELRQRHDSKVLAVAACVCVTISYIKWLRMYGQGLEMLHIRVLGLSTFYAYVSLNLHSLNCVIFAGFFEP